jgi:hypothetical protein
MGAQQAPALMDNNDDVSIPQVIAMVGIAVVLIVPIAAMLAGWIKRRFAAAVVRLQLQTASAHPSDDNETAPDARLLRATTSTAKPMVVDAPPVRAAPAASSATVDHAARPARALRAKVLSVQLAFGLLLWLVVLVFVIAALGSAMDLTEPQASQAPSADSGLASTLSFNFVAWPILLTPPVLAWAVQAGVRTRWLVTGFLLGAVLVGIGNELGGSKSIVDSLLAMAVLAAPGGLLLAFMRPSVRGAGPSLIASLTVAWLVFSAALAAAVSLAYAIDPSEPEGDIETWQEWAVVAALLAALAALALWMGWRTLRRIQRRYAQKQFSEVQLALGAYWGLIVATGLGVILVFTIQDKINQLAVLDLCLLVLLIWWLWRAGQRLVLRWAVRRAPPPLPPLLLLRVFKPSARSEEFMDRFLARWRFAGPVWMIAGPDLAGAYMEPDEFFLFIQRKLHERFITRHDEIHARVEALDNQRDPDGRFRVNDLYCSNSTWKATASALIERAGVIVLDLREYNPARAGTRFELRDMLERGVLDKLIVLVDANGGPALLQDEIRALWQEMAQAGTVQAGLGPLRVLTLGADSDSQLRGLVEAVAATAARARQGTQAETIQPSIGSMAAGKP